MSADELKIQMRSSLDAEEQIIDSLYGVNLAFVVEEEEGDKIRQIDEPVSYFRPQPLMRQPARHRLSAISQRKSQPASA